MDTIVTPVTVITLDSTRIVHSIKADLVARYFPPVVRLVQYDQSLPVIAVSMMQNGQPYTLPSGAAANIRVHKPDATYVYNPALGCDSTRNIVYFEVTQAMAAANGDGLAIVEIVVDGDIAGTSLITLHFEENPVPEDAIESSDEWETIYELGERIIASTVTPVSTAAGMTDHNVVYLYTGTESGWNQGHMYYYNGTTWVDAGIAVTDKTLTVEGLAADAKKTGEEIADLKDGLTESVGDLKSAMDGIGNITYIKESGFISNSGTVSPASSNNEVYTSKIPAIVGQSFLFAFKSSTHDLGNWCAYALYDGSGNFISRTVFISNVLAKEVSQIITIPRTAQNNNVRYIAFSWRNFNDGEDNISISDLNNVLSQVKGECIVPLILSQAKNYVDITIGDTSSSIKFPADVLACINTGYVQITNAETELDISSSAIATTAIKVVYNLSTKVFELCAYDMPLSTQQILIASIRRHTANPSIYIGCNYVLNGKPFGIDFINGHAHVLSINHRGYYTAPENTLPAYILSKQKGFDYVECDVAFTSDGVPVLLHDATINRTARNDDGSTISQEININDITYEQALQYDFGIYKSASYAGTKIPTLAQFIGLCKNLGLYPYIEIKDTATYSEAQISGIVDMVKSYGMLRDVTWISFNSTYLSYVNNADNSARLGLVCGDITTAIIESATSLKTSTNNVFIDAYYSDPAHQVGNIPRCIAADLPVEVWTVDTTSAIIAMNPYITGVTSNRLDASSVLYGNAMSN